MRKWLLGNHFGTQNRLPMTVGTVTAGGLLRRGLAALAVEAVYGAPLPGMRVVHAEPLVAALLAEAHLLVHRTRCAVHADGVLTVVDRPARFPLAAPPVIEIADADALVDAWRTADAHLGAARPLTPGPNPVADAGAFGPSGRHAAVPSPTDAAAGGGALGAVALRLGVDLRAPVGDRAPVPPEPSDRWVEPSDEDVERLAAARAPVALVGPGVATPAWVPGLHALATAGSLGVLNTWGAKGVFHWRSRHHWATVGLQARDFELGGLADADLVIAAGLDEREAPADVWRIAPVVTLDPGALGPLAERWSRPRTDLEVPPLRAGLAAVTQEGWARDTTPLVPTRVTLAYGTVLGSGGLVAADPGTAGYWVARTFATTSLGGAVVPARPGATGLAAACVTVARLRTPDRPALAVVDAAEPDAVTARVVEAAARLGLAVPVEGWGADGPRLGPDAHVDRLRRAVAAERSTTLPLATDPAQLERMIDVAGPIVAWR